MKRSGRFRNNVTKLRGSFWHKGNLQDEDHEEQKDEDFSHDPEVLDGASPVAETPVGVGDDVGQQG